jgi:hypothetical protein
MSTAIIHFTGILQNRHNLQPGDRNAKFMESKVDFNIELKGKTHPNMSAILRQPSGSDYSTEPIEAEKPMGDYAGNWNHNAFRDVAEDYYRRSLASVVGIKGGGSITMIQNQFQIPRSYEIEIPD